MARKGGTRTKTGIGRSLEIYYRDDARAQRMDVLNAAFVASDALVFDIGAHLGDRTASFLRLGASVVAVEPQPRVFRALRLLHGRKPNVALLPCAIGKEVGEVMLHLNTRNPTVATVAPDFITAATDAPGWADQVWDDSVTVPVTTLDALIVRYGVPDFMKIDVEGHEAEVLGGLSTAVAALSFEFTTIQRSVAHDCIDKLCALGVYRFNISLGENHKLEHRDWLTAKDMHAEIDALPDDANSGDVYAKLI
ncbi:FkbM family methyltransferase [Marivita sp.]|uniref:FkbM family methyltransferase n=1 Tax=Marivita sp. TaxID=2003365 RepID=UPI003F6B4AF8